MMTLDAPDVTYLLLGAAFLGLTFLPLLQGRWLVGVPTVYVAAGVVLALLPFTLPPIDPMGPRTTLVAVERLTELIVIIALAGAGLAVDRQAGRDSWQHTWWLLGVAMPATIVALAWLGIGLLGLPLAAAVLLGAVLAPTDPVLAREVAVDGPNEGEEDDVRVTLTTEAGLNDGLAFPFVHLAIALAASAVAGSSVLADIEQADLLGWLGFDVAWRIAAGLAVGWGAGWVTSHFIFSRYGDAAQGGANAGLVLLGVTFLAYGAAEAVDGYGFLAVFLAARAGRAFARESDGEHYVVKPHQFSDQIEKILLAGLLLWLGAVAASGLLDGWTWSEGLVAVLLVFVIRPVAGLAALLPTRGSLHERAAIAFFGIRGFGTVYYVAYAQSHAEFAGIDAVWRVSVLAILLSILVHGALAGAAMRRLSGRRRHRSAVDPLDE